MIVTLKNEKFVSQIDSFGAQLISLKDNAGNEYIWQRKAPFWKDCAPILFPIVGRPVDGVITIDGKDYEMDLHGFAQYMDFEVVSQSDCEVVFVIRTSEESLKKYPYYFEFYVKYVLDDEGIDTQMKIVNADKKEILFGIGGHPGISCPIFDGDSFEDYVIDFGKDADITAVTCDDECFIVPDSAYKLELAGGKLPVKRDLFVHDAIVIERAPFDKINFINKENKGIRFEFVNFKSFAMWTMWPDEAPFICFEPWNSMGKRTGENSNLKDKMDIVELSEGKEFECSYKICPLN